MCHGHCSLIHEFPCNKEPSPLDKIHTTTEETGDIGRFFVLRYLQAEFLIIHHRAIDSGSRRGRDGSLVMKEKLK